ncbi:MAG: YbaB/EbfC family nucleoid-associated protein [Alphaproteobacteria bacterium]|nr:YbaB/EbfC family nucleoid-associated protein [Alphaproteobacteria bacterium]
MKNIFSAMQDLGKIQQKMTEMKESIDDITVEGKAGGDMVCIQMKGDGTVQAIEIKPNLLEMGEVEILQDLLATAFNNAQEKLDAAKSEKTKDILQGIPLPEGFKLPF